MDVQKKALLLKSRASVIYSCSIYITFCDQGQNLWLQITEYAFLKKNLNAYNKV